MLLSIIYLAMPVFAADLCEITSESAQQIQSSVEIAVEDLKTNPSHKLFREVATTLKDNPPAIKFSDIVGEHTIKHYTNKEPNVIDGSLEDSFDPADHDSIHETQSKSLSRHELKENLKGTYKKIFNKLSDGGFVPITGQDDANYGCQFESRQFATDPERFKLDYENQTAGIPVLCRYVKKQGPQTVAMKTVKFNVTVDSKSTQVQLLAASQTKYPSAIAGTDIILETVARDGVDRTENPELRVLPPRGQQGLSYKLQDPSKDVAQHLAEVRSRLYKKNGCDTRHYDPHRQYGFFEDLWRRGTR